MSGESACPTLLLLHRALSDETSCACHCVWLSAFGLGQMREAVLQLFSAFLCFQKRVCTLLKINMHDLYVPLDPIL